MTKFGAKILIKIIFINFDANICTEFSDKESQKKKKTNFHHRIQ